MNTLITCKKGFEKILENELALYGISVSARGSGWVMALIESDTDDLCFAYQVLEKPKLIKEAAVNALATKLQEAFIKHIGEKRLEQRWFYSFDSAGEEQLAGRAKTVEKVFFDMLTKRMARVVKLGHEGIPSRDDSSEGFFVLLSSFTESYYSFAANSGGQKRMKTNPSIPSRSYLKLEEAFNVFGFAPRQGENVVDLGAAPGGWSYSALYRGASVTAIDNGPLQEPVASHPKLTHLKTDALKYKGSQKNPVDWLLCDILEAPEVVLEMVTLWVEKGWCRRFIVNLKLQKTDPIALIQKIRDPNEGLASYCSKLKIRQLYHDREEITLMGEVEL